MKTSPSGSSAVAAARARFQGSLAQRTFRELKTLDFSSQTMLFAGGLLISLLPFLILLSGFASVRVDRELALRLGLDPRASLVVTRLFTAVPASLNAATVTSLIFVAIGSLSVAGSLQQIYAKAFRSAHRGMRDLYRLPVWIAALCLFVAFESEVGRPVRDLADGFGLVEVLTFVIMTAFFWWTMHFLLAGRVRWRRLLPSALATGALFAGLGVFSKFYFSAEIISDNRTYGAIGAVFSIMTWFVAIAAVVIVGAVTGVVWQDRRRQPAVSYPGSSPSGPGTPDQ